ncbi:hypothetical protein [Thermopirellula anaerolimosa]
MATRNTSLTVLTLIATMVAGASGCATIPLGGLHPASGSGPTTSSAGPAEKDVSGNIGEEGDSKASEVGNGSAKTKPLQLQPDATQNVGEGDAIGRKASVAASEVKDEKAGTGDITIQSLIAELEASQPLEPTTRQRLIDDLQRTPPHLWPAVVQLFRATLAYRRTEASRQGEASSQPTRDDRNDASVVQAALSSPATNSALSFGGSAGGEGQRNDGMGSENQPQSGAALGEAAPAVAIMPPPPKNATVSPTTATISTPSPGYETPNAGTSPNAWPRSATTQTPGASEIGSSQPSVAASSVRPTFPEVESTANPLPPNPAERDWRYLLNSARWQLESRIKTDAGGSNLQDELRLRLLNLALADREGAVRPVAGLPPNMQDFWSKTFFGLSLMITDTPSGDAEIGQVSTLEAQRYLQDALQRLQENCPLEIRNPAFVTAVQSWGVYDPFEKNEFSPGRQVLLYAEIENLKSESTAQGYRTSWQSSYRILDESGRVVADYQYPPNEEFCRRVRRDFFIGCELSIPPQLTPGRYALRLSVTDLLSRRTGETSIEFSVPEKVKR